MKYQSAAPVDASKDRAQNPQKTDLSEITPMEIVDDRRKRLFPNLRRFVVDYDLKVSEGRVALNVLSESMSADR